MVRNFFDPSIFKQMLPKQGISSAPAFDMKQLMETQTRNMQAINDVMRLGFEIVQQAFARQTEILGRMVQDNSSYASSILREGTPEQKVQRQAELVRKSYEDTVSSAREVGDLISKASEEASDIINRRVSDSLAELKAAFEHGSPMVDADDVKSAVKTTQNAMKSTQNAVKDTVKKTTSKTKAA